MTLRNDLTFSFFMTQLPSCIEEGLVPCEVAHKDRAILRFVPKPHHL